MKIQNKLMLLAIVLLIVTNPLSGQYILQGLDWMFQQVFLLSGYIAGVATVYIMVYVYLNRPKDKAKIPNKTSKTKAQKYLETM